MVSKKDFGATNFPGSSFLSRRFDLVFGYAEQEEVVVADALSDFNVRAVQGTDDQATVHLELHVRGTEASVPAVEMCWDNSEAGIKVSATETL